jgi:predicted component of type VI protein secretion system
MKRIVPVIFILTILLAGCGSSKKQLEKGKILKILSRSIFLTRLIKLQMNRIMKESVC